MKGALIAIRAILAIDFLRVGLSFWPRFEGTASRSGLADRLFDGWTLGGFRCDFVWLAISTFGALIAAIYLGLASRQNPKLKTDAYLCIAWVSAFIVWLIRLFASGLIDFG